MKKEYTDPKDKLRDALRQQTLELCEFLEKNPDIPSISPGTGIHLVEIYEKVLEKMKECSNPVVLKQLRKYANALKEVCIFNAIHQGVVLAVVGSAIKGMKKE